MKKLTLSRFERETLNTICIENECTMSELIDAIMSNVVRSELSIQIHYNKTGELPK